jgi:hypothetical protein
MMVVRLGTAVGLVMRFTKGVPRQVTLFTHLLSYGTYFGTVLYTTFILGIVLFKELPRQTFGKVQSKLFPIYFNSCTLLLLLQLGTALQLGLQKGSLIALGVSLVATLVNLLFLEPASTKIMFKRYSLENVSSLTS